MTTLAPPHRKRRAHLGLAGLAISAVACLTLLSVAIAADDKLVDGYPVTGTADAKVTFTTKNLPSGQKRVRARYGPIHIAPGQNINALVPSIPGPGISGSMTRFAFNLELADGTIPGVDILHLHHAVWIASGLNFPGGEEKTIASLPAGYGWKLNGKEPWVLNHMIHNLYPSKADVYLTWDMDVVPEGSPQAKRIRPVTPLFMDVRGGQAYPVFDVLRKTGTKGAFAYPDQAKNAYPSGQPLNRLVLPTNGVLVRASGHIHPGGKFTDLRLTRNGRTVKIFRSGAKYFEPAGPVSWDMAMTHSRKDWRIAFKKGDVLSVSATYETKRASWYESMGIIVADAEIGATNGVDPFASKFDATGKVTHGPLKENSRRGGKTAVFADPRPLPDGPTFDANRVVTVKNFVSSQGDLSRRDASGRPPVIAKGSSLTFVNADAKDTIYHSITSCEAPCNRDTGVAYPIANGPQIFDSAELGFGPAGTTAAANRDRWSTPKTLPTGTYTYFCRIHPFMRGAFRVR